MGMRLWGRGLGKDEEEDEDEEKMRGGIKERLEYFEYLNVMTLEFMGKTSEYESERINERKNK